MTKEQMLSQLNALEAQINSIEIQVDQIESTGRPSDWIKNTERKALKSQIRNIQSQISDILATPEAKEFGLAL